jgi:hypothetical protein
LQQVFLGASHLFGVIWLQEGRMQEATEGPIFLVEALLFVLRCVVPLLLMLGVSYLLKRFGLISPPPPPPPDRDNENNHDKSNGGGVAHGKA